MIQAGGGGGANTGRSVGAGNLARDFTTCLCGRHTLRQALAKAKSAPPVRRPHHAPLRPHASHPPECPRPPLPLPTCISRSALAKSALPPAPVHPPSSRVPPPPSPPLPHPTCISSSIPPPPYYLHLPQCFGKVGAVEEADEAKSLALVCAGVTHNLQAWQRKRDWGSGASIYASAGKDLPLLVCSCTAEGPLMHSLLETGGRSLSWGRASSAGRAITPHTPCALSPHLGLGEGRILVECLCQAVVSNLVTCSEMKKGLRSRWSMQAG